MIKKIILTSVRAVAILIFAALIGTAVGGMQASKEAEWLDELRRNEELYRSIPVTVTVVPTVNENGREDSIDPWTVDLFTGKNPVEIVESTDRGTETKVLTSWAEYLKDVRVRISDRINQINGSPVYSQNTIFPNLIGITSIPSDEQLLSENGCEIKWYDGYDESIFGNDEPLCLVPADMAADYDNGNGETVLYFCEIIGKMENGTFVETGRREYECSLKIAGTYTGGDGKSIYCPLTIILQVYDGMGDGQPDIEAISATIADNMLLDEFRETASVFFPELAESSESVPKITWVHHRSRSYTFSYGRNAMKIADDELFDYSDTTLEESINFDRTLKQGVIVVSVAAGVLFGLLIFLLRKRDIKFKRENGKFAFGIYISILLEQIICISLGIAASGARYMWEPIDKLLLFALVYLGTFAVVSLIPVCIVISKTSKRMNDDCASSTNYIGKIILRTLKYLKRMSVRAVALLLFAVLITAVICGLEASNEAEVSNFEEACQTFPITVTVTTPTGRFTRTEVIDDKEYEFPITLYVYDWVYELFASEEPVEFYDASDLEDTRDMEEIKELKSKTKPIELSLAEYVKDIQVTKGTAIDKINGAVFNEPYLYGITSLSCDTQLSPEDGCEIEWYAGYDESIFDGEEPLCLIPAGKAEKYDNGNGEAVLGFVTREPKVTFVDGELVIEYEEQLFECPIKIAGTYTGGDWNSIYCPIPFLEELYEENNRLHGVISFLSMTLADNSRLEEFREKMSFCFLEPSPESENVPWGYLVNSSYWAFYEFSLDIDDEEIKDLKAALEERIEFNRRISLAVLAVSAIAVFVIGLFNVRSRKQDIMLMRTAGESKLRVYLTFVLEQMIYIILGIVVGGVCFLWKPIDKVLIFALICFVGILITTVIAMSKKLIKTIKEVQS